MSLASVSVSIPGIAVIVVVGLGLRVAYKWDDWKQAREVRFRARVRSALQEEERHATLMQRLEAERQEPPQQ